MQTLNNQKLISTSNKILLISRILLVTLALSTLIPWLIPTSKVGEFLLGMYSVFNFVPKTQGGIDVISRFSLLSRGLGFIGSVISTLPLMIGSIIMIRLTRNYTNGEVFSTNNAKSYTKLGITYLLSALVLQPLSQVFFSLAVSINNSVGQRFIEISFDVANLTAIFFAILLIVIGQVMKLGQEINQEQELTI